MAIVTNQVSTAGMVITTSNPPSSPTDAGIPGTIAWDENFIYVCVSENLWSRTSINANW